ncbi:MAG TPA: translation initiation factor IF-5A [Candidatus Nanopusillus sp.]|nr:translation initiation factor IF-5A [Candidatus Nanopusillus sp.]
MVEIQIKKVIDLKPGNYIWYNGKVYKVINVETSKTGKHGSAKARIEAISFDGNKVVIIKPTQDPIEVPMIKKIKGQVISVLSEDRVMVMDMDTYETFEAVVTDDLKGKLTEGQRVVVWDIGEKVVMQAFKE